MNHGFILQSEGFCMVNGTINYMRSECFKTFQKWVKISKIIAHSSKLIKIILKVHFSIFVDLADFTGNECASKGEFIDSLIKEKSILGLSFPIIRNKDENLKLGSFLRMTLFDRNTWTEKYTRSNNISIFGMLHIVCPIDGRTGDQYRGCPKQKTVIKWYVVTTFLCLIISLRWKRYFGLVIVKK